MTLYDLGIMYGNSNPTADGFAGECFELACKVRFDYPLSVSPKNAPDLIGAYNGFDIECKTNGGELPLNDARYMLYSPYVDLQATPESLTLYLVEYEDFLDFMDAENWVRWAKTDSVSHGGGTKASFQTVWNYSKNAPHSKKKYNAIIAYLQSHTLI